MFDSFLHKGPSSFDVLQFFKIIARHYKASRPLTTCVEEYIKATDNREMKQICQGMHKSLQGGSDFSAALKKAKIFDPFIVEFIDVGEKASKLDVFFTKICNRLRQDIAIKRKVKSATLLPKISMVIIFFAFLFGVYYLIPKIATALNDIKMDLPLITKLALSFGNVFATFWWIIPMVIFGVVFSVRYYKKTHPIEFSLLALRMPFYKDIAYYRIHYDFCEIFALCLDTGFRSVDALNYTGMAMENLYMKKILHTATGYMEQGLSLPDAIKKADYEKVLNNEVLSMLKTGIETSKTADIMISEAESYLDELENAMETIGDKVSVAVLTPSYGMMILFFGVIEYPMTQITQNFGKLSRGAGL